MPQRSPPYDRALARKHTTKNTNSSQHHLILIQHLLIQHHLILNTVSSHEGSHTEHGAKDTHLQQVPRKQDHIDP